MQNINATLPKWDADAHNHLHAIVDMGRSVCIPASILIVGVHS